MIYTIYDHGGDDPATGLTTAQLSGALKDAAGTLWVDLEAASATEREAVLVQALGLEPGGLAAADQAEPNTLSARARHFRLTAGVPSENGSAAAAPLALYLGSNFVVTSQTGSRFIAAIRNQSTQGLPGGAAALAARILSDTAGAWTLRLGELKARLGQLESAAGSGQGTTGKAIYAVRVELEELRYALPAMAGNCRTLAAEGSSIVPAASRPAFYAVADLLDRQALAAERLGARADLALAAHTADLAATIAGAVRWAIVATLAAGAAVAAAVLLSGR